MTQELIDEINEKCPYNQGIFFQPSGISTDIKELVIYSRYESEGRGGSCWDDENTVNDIYHYDAPKDHFKVLDIVLEGIAPKLSYLQYKKIQELVKEDSNTESGYRVLIERHSTSYSSSVIYQRGIVVRSLEHSFCALRVAAIFQSGNWTEFLIIF